MNEKSDQDYTALTRSRILVFTWRTAISSGATWSACAQFELLWIENISLFTNTGSLFTKLRQG